MKKHFVNLSNGCEKIPELESFDFMRIQSTTIERKDWIKLLYDLDHNFLMWCALGCECNVYDYGTNRLYSKSIYLGVPIIIYCLNRFWYGCESSAYRLTRGGILMRDVEQFQHIYNELFVFNSTKEKERVKTKLKYYKKFLNSDKVNIIGHSESTSNDGNHKLQFEILKSHLNEYSKASS